MPQRLQQVKAHDWLEPSVRKVMESMTASYAERCGFSAGMMTLARRDTMVVVAAYGLDALLMGPEVRVPISEVIGRQWPVSHLTNLKNQGQRWGFFTFVDGDTLPDDSPFRWSTETPRSEAPNAWQPNDFLVAGIRDETGDIRGAIFLTNPISGVRPTSDLQEVLDTTGERLSIHLLSAMERQTLGERLKVANAGRIITRGLLKPQTIEAALTDSLEVLMEHMNITGLWIQVFDSSGKTMMVRTMGDGVEDLPNRRRLGEFYAPRLWDNDAVGFMTPSDFSGFDKDGIIPVQRFLLDSMFSSLVLVPSGAGARCLGALIAVRKAGAREWTTDELDEITELGRDLGVALAVALNHDIESRARRELERLADFRAELVSTVSHELRNPLTTASFNLDVLSKSISDEADLRSLERVSRGLRRMQRVVDDLLRLSRSGPDDNEKRPWEVVDLSVVVSDLCDLNRAWAKSVGVSLHTGVHGRVLVECQVDDLRRAITNLLGNAVKYTPAGGQVTVTVRARGEREAEVTIEDTGVGMSIDDQKGAFEEFFRSADPRVREKEGTGLGLPLARRIVHDHGGRIGLKSELDCGTTLWMHLPLAPAVD